MSADSTWIANQVEASREMFPGSKREYRPVTEQRTNDPLVHTFGRAAADAETKVSTDGQKTWVRFRIAVDTSYDRESQPRWFDVSVWNEGLMESVKAQVYKGAVIAVEGFYTQHEYNGKTYDQIRATKVGLITWLAATKRASTPSGVPAPAAALPPGVTPEMLAQFASFQASQKPAATAAPQAAMPVAPVAAPPAGMVMGDLPF